MNARLKISLEDTRFFAYHGVMEQERKIGNEFVVNLSVFLPLRSDSSVGNVVTDEIGDTVSYADLYDIVAEQMRVPCRLIEHLAARIIDGISNRWCSVDEVNVRITKTAPPIPNSDCKASVEIHWHR